MLHKLGDPFYESIKYILKRDIKFIEVVDEGLHALNKRRVSKLLDLSKSYDLKFSVHAPYADINIASPSSFLLRAMVKRLLASLVNAHFLEARLWILHPGIETGVSMFYPSLGLWCECCHRESS
jgi:sugar phosphate isomerase/epimerase